MPSGRSTSCRALAAEPVRQNSNGTYYIEVNRESHVAYVCMVEYKYSRSCYVALIVGFLTIAAIHNYDNACIH